MPFYVTRKDGVSLTFAGLLERWGPDNLLTCTILTTDSSDGIRSLHTRMPVILAKESFEPWLSGNGMDRRFPISLVERINRQELIPLAGYRGD